MMSVESRFEAARAAHPLALLINGLLTEGPDAANNPQRTALALEFLIQYGQIGAVRSLAPVLASKFDADPYFINLKSLLDGMPEVAVSGNAFIDDIQADLQIVMHPEAQATLLAFCGSSHRLGMPLGVFHAWIQPWRLNVIYMRDFHQRYYLDGLASIPGGFPALCARLRETPALNASLPLLCIGSSRGGYGAIKTAMALAADAVLSLAGPTHLGASFIRDNALTTKQAELYAWRPELAAEGATDLRPQWLAHRRQGHRTTLRMVYGEANHNDAVQARHVAGLPGVTLNALPGCSAHNMSRELCDRGLFDTELAAWIQTGVETHDGLLRSAD